MIRVCTCGRSFPVSSDLTNTSLSARLRGRKLFCCEGTILAKTNSCQNKDFQHFSTKITVPTNSTEIFCKSPSPSKSMLFVLTKATCCMIFSELQKSTLPWGGVRGHLLFRSTFPFCDKGFGEDCRLENSSMQLKLKN